MTEPLDLSALDAIPEEVEEKLSSPWRRIFRAFRKLQEGRDGGT